MTWCGHPTPRWWTSSAEPTRRRREITAARFLFTILLGFASGFTSGAFGIGGGSITTPAIRLLLSEPPGIALGTPLPIVFPSALVGGFNYWRSGKVNPRVFIYCSLLGVIGTVTGSYLTSYINIRYIMILTALVIFYLAYRTFNTAMGKEPYGTLEAQGAVAKAEVWKLALIGITAGFFSGFLGLGGGVILIPAFFFLLHMEIKECLGTSLVIIAALSVPGTIVHSRLGHVDWLIAMAMTIGVMPGAYVGSFFTLRSRNRRVLFLFSLLLFAIGIIFLVKEIRGLL
jgi:uncharacterized membrane protein YfcA